MSSVTTMIAETMQDAARVIIKLRTQLSRLEDRLEELESELLESGNYFRCDLCKKVVKESQAELGTEHCVSCADAGACRWSLPIEGHD